MLPLDVAFWSISAVMVGSALGVVLVKDIFRAALLLVLSFLAVAGLFVLLNAEFLAVVQVLIYVGAISILIIFAIMLTRNVQEGNPSNGFDHPARILATLVLVAIVFVAVSTDWNTWDSLGLNVLPGDPAENLSSTEQGVRDVFGNTTPVIASLLLREFVLPFEVASVVLLAAVIGALALVRESENEV